MSFFRNFKLACCAEGRATSTRFSLLGISRISITKVKLKDTQRSIHIVTQSQTETVRLNHSVTVSVGLGATSTSSAGNRLRNCLYSQPLHQLRQLTSASHPRSAFLLNTTEFIKLSRNSNSPNRSVTKNRRYSKHSYTDSAKGVMASAEKKSVCIVGSGNWGSAIAKIVGSNLQKGSDEFNSNINMYVYEEMFEGRKLSEIINQDHENKKYLPGIKLPENVRAVTDLASAADGADILIFVVPHQFIRALCKQLNGKMKKSAIAVSLIKGLDVKEGGGLLLISDIITECLSIPCHVLMGANLAGEVAEEKYCEATVGAKVLADGLVVKRLLQTEYFRLVVVEDAPTVEICGALKNIVALGAGIADGLNYGDNAKAAVIRLGLMEMIKFVDTFYENTQPSTFLESCGVADLVTTCYGGRNRKVAAAMVTTGKSIEVLEKEMLNGQKLQGPPTATEVNVMLRQRNLEKSFPMFVVLDKICKGLLPPEAMKEVLCTHPVHQMETVDESYMRKFHTDVSSLNTPTSSYFSTD